MAVKVEKIFSFFASLRLLVVAPPPHPKAESEKFIKVELQRIKSSCGALEEFRETLYGPFESIAWARARDVAFVLRKIENLW